MNKSVITAATPAFSASEGTTAVARFNISPGLDAAARVSVRIEGWGATPGTDFGALKVSFDGTHFTTVQDGVITIPAGATRLFLSTSVASDNLSHEPGEQIAFVLAQTPEAYDVLDGSYYVSSVATVVDATAQPARISGLAATIREGDFAIGRFNLDVPLGFATSVDARVEGYGITLGQDTTGSLQVRIDGSGSWTDVSNGKVQLPAGSRYFELRVATVSDSAVEHAETMNFVVAQTDHLLRESYYVSSLITVQDATVPSNGSSNGSSSGASSGSSNSGATTTAPNTVAPTGGSTGASAGNETNTGGAISGGTTAPTDSTTTNPTNTNPTTTNPTTTNPTTTNPTNPTNPATPTTPVSNTGPFTVHETNGVITFGGAATGEISVFLNPEGQAVFSRDGQEAETVVRNVSTKLIDSGATPTHFNLFGSPGNDTLKFVVNESPDPDLIPNLLTLRGDLGAGADKLVLVFPDAPGAAMLEPGVVSTVFMPGNDDTLEAQVLGADDRVLLHPGSVVTDVEQIVSAAGTRFDASEVLLTGAPAAGSATFTVTEANGKVTFGGSATGEITVTFDTSGAATFSRGGVNASTVVSNMASKMLSSADAVTLFNVIGTEGADNLNVRMEHVTGQLVLRGHMLGGADTVKLSFPNGSSEDPDRRKVVINSTLELFDLDDTFAVVQDDADDDIILDDGSFLADFENFNTGTADLVGVTFIGMRPPPAE